MKPEENRSNKDGRKPGKKNIKSILPIRVIMLSAGITFVGLIGLFILSFKLDVIKRNYNQGVKKDFVNLEYVNQISNAFYKHQTLTYKYMTSMEDSEKSSEIEKAAQLLQEEIERIDKLFGENVIGTGYESEYHSIHSGINGYFNSVSYIFEFHSDGDLETAEYYMDSKLSKDIDSIVTCLDKLEALIDLDAEVSQEELSARLGRYKKAEWIFIVVLALIALFGYARCVRITYDIINKDALTKVFNTGRLGREMARWQKKGRLQGYACICSNIKGLSLINRRYGTHIGDMVLAKFAAVIGQTIGKDERMARIGGDNFMFIIHSDRIDEMLTALGRVTVPVDVGDGVVVFNLENRCGIYMIEQGDAFGTMLDAAYLAVHQAKQTSLPDNIWFDQSLLAQTFERKNILAQYKKGIANREFVAYYQPKVDMTDDSLCGCEALVRWKQGDSLVPPFKFIPMLEDEGSITDLDFYIFENVCQDIRSWLDEGYTPVRVSSNFSKLHLQNSDFAEHVLSIVGKYQVPHELIEIELTESSGYENFKALTDFVSIMNENDICVSIDDFGTGYSSLSLLKDLNVDVIKLDKSFIDALGNGDSVNEKLVKNVIHMIRDLNRDIICEGVETKEQAKFLMEQDCYKVQGYLYDKPLPREEFEKRLKTPKY